jgi:hypothetical protein
MKRSIMLAFFLVTSFVLIAPSAFAQRQTENLQSRIIERFDGPEDDGRYDYRQNHRWIVRGSKFVTEGFPRFGWVNTWPQALYRVPPQGVELRSLGVEAAFDRMGYNFLEFIPVEDENDANGNPVPKGIPIPGRVRNLDMWVWGSNHNYYMDVHLMDHRGVVHVLRLGDINYRGWQNLRVNIPTFIPQDVVWIPQQRGLELVRLVMWTRPTERVSGFFIYLDEIKVFTDVFEDPFDGEGLTFPDEVRSLWDNAVEGN